MDSHRRPLRLALFLSIIALFANIALSQSTGSAPISNGPVNITVTNFTVPSTLGLNAPAVFFVSLQNSGGFASGNMTANLNVKGPSTSFNTTYFAAPLSPFQNESLTISVVNASAFKGSYIATISASYIAKGSLQYTKSLSRSYTVINVQPQSNTNTSIPVHNSELSVSYVPLYTALISGTQSVSQIGIKNLLGSPESVNISVGSNYSKLISLSTSSSYLQPNQALNIQILLKAQSSNASIATYNIPITFNVNPASGSPSILTQYITLTISNRTALQPRLLNDVIIANSTNSTGIIEVHSGSNQSINNATLVTTIPSNVTNNASSVKTYGLQANVSRVGGTYKMYWAIPYLPPAQVVYAYYKINNLADQQFPLHIQNLLLAPSILRATSILKVVNFSLPTFYTNSTNKITVSILYTGTSGQKVYFYLTAPPGINVYNATQITNATPNELLTKSFQIITNRNSGTIILNLYVNTQGANTTYSLPVVVLQNQSTVIPPTTTIRATGSGISINTKDVIKYAEIIVAIILIVLLIYGVMVMLGRPRYKKARATELITIKEQIKRQQGDNNG